MPARDLPLSPMAEAVAIRDQVRLLSAAAKVRDAAPAVQAQALAAFDAHVARTTVVPKTDDCPGDA